MAHKIFTIKNEKLVIHDELILADKYVRKIIEQTESTTKFKGGGTRAAEELAFVYYVADFNSPFNRHGYEEADAVREAKKKIGLPFSWKPSKAVYEAIDAYRSHQSNVSTDTILELLKTFRLHKSVIAKVRASLSAAIKTEKLSKSEAAEITGLIGYILELAKEIPKTVRDLKKAIRELETEDELDREQIRGTEENVPESADPDMA